MFANIKALIYEFWVSIYNADSWERSTLILAICATFVVSSIFTYRMARYKDKTFLEWMILLREIGWLLLGFRYVSALTLDWDWNTLSWLLWAYIGTTTLLALVASQREHLLARFHNRGSRWRVRPRKG